MSAIDLQLCVLTPTDEVDFDCGDAELNEFFQVDSLVHQCNFLSKTYYCKDNSDRIVSMVSVCNDNIKFSEEQRKKFTGRKRFPSYPAVKIARLGVSSTIQGGGLGTQIMDFLKIFFVIRNKTGCRFLTVDAYNNDRTLRFYRKNGFSFLKEGDKEKRHRAMYFDLLPYYNGLTEETRNAMGNSIAELIKAI